MIEREYYPLDMAARLLSRDVEDLIYWGAVQAIDIYALIPYQYFLKHKINSQEDCGSSTPHEELVSRGGLFKIPLYALKDAECIGLSAKVDSFCEYDDQGYSAYLLSFVSKLPLETEKRSLPDMHLVVKTNDLRRLQGQTDETRGQWPWGKYDTKLLRIMAEAAEKFWSRYVPGENDTAPTNEQVKDWLTSQRGVAERVAPIMAQILRADGLPPGPRK